MNIQANMIFRRRLPLLLIPTSDRPGSPRNLYSLPDGQVYDLRLPVPYNTRCIGSCHGWLIFIEPISFMLTLFNPFYFGNEKGTIYLPPFSAAMDFSESETSYDVLPEYYICKAVLSSDPVASRNYTVMLIYGKCRNLAYYMSGDESWTCLDGNPLIDDLIYSDGRFTAIDLCGELFVSDPEVNNPQLESISAPLYSPTNHVPRRYIVESNDGNALLQVVKSFEFRPSSNGGIISRTLGFSVYKLGKKREMFDWLELSSIGDAALFVGDSHSYCVKASAFPGIIPNSIYFTDDYRGFSTTYSKNHQFRGPIDAGVFLIREQSFRRHYNPVDVDMERGLPPHIWILPTI
ncbi:putative F-box protein At5g55150 [Silene latifolia]|uniref:putative F-box protein At5g55150 n=1 Tax=Silene latifolia TaxID=37657 RepID=UPI003D774039